MNDFDAVQKFFIQEVQLGEDCIGQGEEEQAVEHLSNAIAVCGQPQSLLQVFASTLPEEVFKKVLERLPMVTQKIRMLAMSQMAGIGNASGPLTDLMAGDAEEDVSIGTLLTGSDGLSGLPSGAFGVSVPPQAASKTSAAFIDDDVE